MKVSLICFTENGCSLMDELYPKLMSAGFDVSLSVKCSALKESRADIYADCALSDWAAAAFQEKAALLFIGATGIAIRAIADSVKNKLSDSPVLVMDELGTHIIPLLSGHVGGANELAVIISQMCGAEAVVTTATDLNGKFAVDLFAKENGLKIVDKDGIARVSSKVLRGMAVSIETADSDRTDVWIRSKGSDEKESLIKLQPKEYCLGLGCRKNKDGEELRVFAEKMLADVGIDPDQLFCITSIDVKKEEPGLIALSEHFGCEFRTYSADELNAVPGEFNESEFVKKTVGVGSVCERSAVLASGEGAELIVPKTAENGMTAAIARRRWRIVIDEK